MIGAVEQDRTKKNNTLPDEYQTKMIGRRGAFNEVYAMTETERWQSTSKPNGPAGQVERM